MVISPSLFVQGPATVKAKKDKKRKSSRRVASRSNCQTLVARWRRSRTDAEAQWLDPSNCNRRRPNSVFLPWGYCCNVAIYEYACYTTYRRLDARSPYLGAGFENALSRSRIQVRPTSAPDSRTPYLQWDFCFSDFVVAALREFKIRLL